MRRAKILATLGPSSSTESVLEDMINAGLNAIRINMSHGTYEEHAERIRVSQEQALRLGSPLAVLVDLSGPKKRSRSLKDGQPVELKKDQTFTITTREMEVNDNEVMKN